MSKMPAFAGPPENTWQDYMAQNQVVRDWSTKVKSQLKDSASRFSKGKSGAVLRGRGSFVGYGKGTSQPRKENKLVKSIQHRVKYRHGISEGVTFRFERHGVFVHKGVGRGYKMVGGQVVRYAKGKANPPRVPVDWFNVIVNHNTEELANKVAEINANASLNAMRLRIV